MRGAPLTNKHAATKTVLPSIKQLQSQLGTVKRYHSEIARERQNGTIHDELKQQGTITTTTTTALHSSQQNIVVERRFRTSFNAVRTELARSNLDQKYWSYAAQEAVARVRVNYIPKRCAKGP